MDLYNVSSSPHLRSEVTVQKIMLDVIIALIPASLIGVYFFGMRALILIAVSTFAAVLSEFVFQKIRKKPDTTRDLSAVVTGILLALNVPSTTPYWVVAVGSVFAIIVVKQLFGGLGQNFMNPALGARVFLMISYTKIMTSFVSPFDAVSAATPLTLINEGSSELPQLLDLLIGKIGGSIGETSALALILGGLYLVFRKVIRYETPLMYILSVFVFTVLFNGFDISLSFYSLFAGGLMLGAFFMATDYSSTPMSIKGQLVFSLGAGFLTSVIRVFGAYPEGVMFSILLMNIATPLIDKYTKPKVFGGKKK